MSPWRQRGRLKLSWPSFAALQTCGAAISWLVLHSITLHYPPQKDTSVLITWKCRLTFDELPGAWRPVLSLIVHPGAHTRVHPLVLYAGIFDQQVFFILTFQRFEILQGEKKSIQIENVMFPSSSRFVPPFTEERGLKPKTFILYCHCHSTWYLQTKRTFIQEKLPLWSSHMNRMLCGHGTFMFLSEFLILP